jgi:hypothetical protein
MIRRGLLVVGILLGVGLIVLSTLTGFLVDWLWFEMLGFGAVFATVWHTQLAAFSIAVGLSTLALAVNGLLAVSTRGPAVRRLRTVRRRDGDEILPEVVELSLDTLPWRRFVLVGAAVIGVFIGLGQAANWDVFLRWRAAVPFERTDPVFGRDLGFYVFTLPVYRVALNWGFVVVVLAVLMAAGIFWVRGAIELGEGVPRLAGSARRQLSGLLGLFLLLKAGSYLVQRYDLLVDASGVVAGAGYTDLHFHLPYLTALVVLALIGTGLCFIKRRDGRAPPAHPGGTSPAVRVPLGERRRSPRAELSGQARRAPA